MVREKVILNGAAYSYKIHKHNTELPYFIMLHGFMGDGRVFNHLTEGLSQVCNMVTIDLLGHGRSEKLHNPERYEEKHQIRDIVEFMRKTELSPVFLYGYSMGGRLALKVALKTPELWSGLILESTTYGILDDEERAKRRKADARRAIEIQDDYPKFLSSWEKLGLFQSQQRVDKALANTYKKIHLEQDSLAIAASLIGFGSGSMEPVKKQHVKFTKPVLITAGTADKKYKSISTTLASYFDDTRLRHIPAGHRVHLDNPKKLTQQLTYFINQNSTV